MKFLKSYHKGDDSGDILRLGFFLVLVPLTVPGAGRFVSKKKFTIGGSALVRKCKENKKVKLK